MAERPTPNCLHDVFFTPPFSRKYDVFLTPPHLRQFFKNDVCFTPALEIRCQFFPANAAPSVIHLRSLPARHESPGWSEGLLAADPARRQNSIGSSYRDSGRLLVPDCIQAGDRSPRTGFLSIACGKVSPLNSL
jgi:hypothetical protein